MLFSQNDITTSVFAKPAYSNNRVYFKTKQTQTIDKKLNVFLSSEIENTLSNLKAKIARIQAPYAKHFKKYGGQLQSSNYGLDRICEIVFEDSVDVFDISKHIAENPEIEYAEPVPMDYAIEYQPNDPQLDQQWHLADIDIYNAWEVVKDKTGVLIGIVDSGTQWDHIDLESNSYTKSSEEINGKDDDGNGYIDDYKGWDFVGNNSYTFQPDNDVLPTGVDNMHGTHVAGCAAAVLDNSKYGTGTAFNSKFVATKHGLDATGTAIYEGYKGIMYCAEIGAKVINCSWGGPGYSIANEEVIKEANSYGCIILVAASNDGSDNDLATSYPSDFPGVISIGATNNKNNVASFSNYGYSTKLFAPGESIYSTVPFNGFKTASGTSMACPIAAGVAALVRSVFPDYDAKQTYHQLRSTLTPLKNNNKKMYGKIDAYKAVSYNNTGITVPGVEVANFELPPFNAFTSYNDKKLKLQLINHIGKANNLQIKLTSLDNCVDFDGGAKSTSAAIGNMDTKDTTFVEINIKLNKNAAIAIGKTPIMVEYSDGSWYDFEVIYVPINISTPVVTALHTIYGVSSRNSYDLVLADVHSYSDNAAFGISYGQYGYYEGYGWSYRIYSHIITDGGEMRYPTLIGEMAYIPISCWRFSNTNKAVFLSVGSNNQYSLYRTADLKNWTGYDMTDKIKKPLKLYFKDDDYGLILCDAVENKWNFGFTPDAGVTWDKVDSSAIPSALDGESSIIDGEPVYYGYGDYFWFATNKGRIYRTKDIKNPNAKWDVYTITDEDITIKSISFGCKSGIDSGMIIFYKNSDKNNDTCFIATTTDKGAKWTYKPLHTISNGGKPVFLQSAVGSYIFALVTDNNSIMITNDFGGKWKNANAKYVSGVKKIFGNSSLVNGNNNRIKIKTIGYSNQYNSISSGEVRAYESMVTTTITEPFFDVVRSVSIQPPSLVMFGTRELGNDTTRIITITNTGDVAVNLSDYKVISDNSETTEDEFRILNKPSNIAVGDNVEVRIRFSPKTQGAKEATIWIANNTDKYPEIGLKLRGTATYTEFAELTTNKTTIEYDTTAIGSYATQTIQITNLGNINTIIDSIIFVSTNSSTGIDEFSIATDLNYPVSLTPQQKQNISVKFAPLYEGIVKTGKMLIYNSGVVNPIEIEINALSQNNIGIIEQDYSIFSPLVPNPAENICYSTLHFDEVKKYSVVLLNSNGEEIEVIEEGEATGEILLKVSTSGLSTGSYFVVLNVAGKQYFNKLSVRK
jgi:subtilisin family serine protease/photosystem II stability/assembly factor-like uncharacterized protein